jgi:hypothetical protein
MKDLLIGLAMVAGTILVGALVLWFIWHYAILLSPFIRAFSA